MFRLALCRPAAAHAVPADAVSTGTQLSGNKGVIEIKSHL